MDYIYKEIENSDINLISKVHLKSFDNTHLTSFFSEDMLDDYYNKLIKYNEFNIMAIEKINSEVVGFVIGGFETSKAIKEYIIKNKIKLILVLLKNYQFLIEKSFYLISNYFKRDKVNSKYYPRLISISILPNYQGLGISNNLINKFENKLKIKNIKSYGLSVRNENKKAINFYIKNSFQVEFKTKTSTYFYKIL